MTERLPVSSQGTAEAGALGIETRGSVLGSGEHRTIFCIYCQDPAGSRWMGHAKARGLMLSKEAYTGAHWFREGSGSGGFCRKMVLRRSIRLNPRRQMCGDRCPDVYQELTDHPQNGKPRRREATAFPVCGSSQGTFLLHGSQGHRPGTGPLPSPLDLSPALAACKQQAC